MDNQFSRSRMMFGSDGIKKLNISRVAVFGVGGVGGYAVEALARTGVGTIDLIDNDTVSLSNINRQIIATRKTVGQYKVDVMKERILDINPDAKVCIYKCFFLPGNEGDFPFCEAFPCEECVNPSRKNVVAGGRAAACPHGGGFHLYLFYAR